MLGLSRSSSPRASTVGSDVVRRQGPAPSRPRPTGPAGELEQLFPRQALADGLAKGPGLAVVLGLGEQPVDLEVLLLGVVDLAGGLLHLA